MTTAGLPDPLPKLMTREHLHLVAPQIRPIVETAWSEGEDVPFGVVFISVRQPTADEIEFGKKLWAERSAASHVQEGAVLATGETQG